MTTEPAPFPFAAATLFASGRLCLDFVNTRYQVRETRHDLLSQADGLRQWLQLAETVFGICLSPDDAAWDSGYEERSLPRALRLRSALNDLIHGVLAQSPISPAALETVNAFLRENPTFSQIVVESGGGFREAISVFQPEDRWLAAIAADAVDLFCHADLSLLRQCDCPTCIRVFYDSTKNHRRRWCVEKCGSAPKAAAYYRRKVAKRTHPLPPPSLAREGEGGGCFTASD